MANAVIIPEHTCVGGQAVTSMSTRRFLPAVYSYQESSIQLSRELMPTSTSTTRWSRLWVCDSTTHFIFFSLTFCNAVLSSESTKWLWWLSTTNADCSSPHPSSLHHLSLRCWVVCLFGRTRFHWPGYSARNSFREGRLPSTCAEGQLESVMVADCCWGTCGECNQTMWYPSTGEMHNFTFSVAITQLFPIDVCSECKTLVHREWHGYLMRHPNVCTCVALVAGGWVMENRVWIFLIGACRIEGCA